MKVTWLIRVLRTWQQKSMYKSKMSAIYTRDETEWRSMHCIITADRATVDRAATHYRASLALINILSTIKKCVILESWKLTM